jgi:hypothetical protein
MNWRGAAAWWLKDKVHEEFILLETWSFKLETGKLYCSCSLYAAGLVTGVQVAGSGRSYAIPGLMVTKHITIHIFGDTSKTYNSMVISNATSLH